MIQEENNQEELTHGGIDNEGHYRCFFCDGIVVHEGSDMAQDIYPDSYGENDVLHYMICRRYGAEYEVIQKENPDGDTPMGDEFRLRKKFLSNEDQ